MVYSSNIKNKPKISVITVVFNACTALKKTLLSVQSQIFEDFEYIIIDGGSSDGTLEILKFYEYKITKWISEPDRGIYDAMNKGLKIARGEYVYFLNAGDTFIERDTLSKVVSHLTNNPVLLMNRVRATSREKKVQIMPKVFGLSKPRETFKSAYCHQGAFVRRDAYLSLDGFDISYKYFADFKALWLIRSLGYFREIKLEVANFPLDGISSNWRLTTKLTKERERLLAELGEESSCFLFFIHMLRAQIYTFRMFICHIFKL